MLDSSSTNKSLCICRFQCPHSISLYIAIIIGLFQYTTVDYLSSDSLAFVSGFSFTHLGTSSLTKSTTTMSAGGSNNQHGLTHTKFSPVNTTAGYTLPGVIHYLQVEWRNFQRAQNEWDLERQDYKNKIAMLELQHISMEAMKVDLSRRVKMLEYALQQERRKSFNNADVSVAYKVDLPEEKDILARSTPLAVNKDDPDNSLTINSRILETQRKEVLKR